jgi:protein SCO1
MRLTACYTGASIVDGASEVRPAFVLDVKSNSFSSYVARGAIALALLGLLVVAGCHHQEAPGSYAAVNQADVLPNVIFTDQFGKPVALSSLKGKLVLVDFIYTSCASVCPRLTARMNEVAKKLGAEVGQRVTIVSFTLDPEHDTPQKLRNYAEAQGIAGNGWLFLTGEPAQIDQELARFQLVRQRESDGSVTHNVAAFLVGPDGHEIRQYNALDVPIDTIVSDVDRSKERG